MIAFIIIDNNYVLLDVSLFLNNNICPIMQMSMYIVVLILQINISHNVLCTCTNW